MEPPDPAGPREEEEERIELSSTTATLLFQN